METEGSSESISADTAEATAFRVPGNIDFELKSSFDKLIYDKVTMENVSGLIKVKDQTIFIDDLKADVYEGAIVVNGNYTTKDRTDPLVDIDFKIKEINIADAYSSFGIMEKLAPVAEHVFGTFSTNLAFKTDLDHEMMPILSSMMGNGLLNTSQVKVENIKSLNALSGLLKIEELKALDLNPLSVLFTIEEGKVDVKPFAIQSGQLKANVSGWTAFDQRINYVMNMSIPRKMFGNQANEVLDGLLSKANMTGTNLSLGETIDLDVLFTGTATDPKVSTNLANLGKNIIDDTRKQLEEELKKKEEEAKKKASEEAQRILDEADAQAKKILQQAQVKADEVIMAAEAAAIEVRTGSDKQAKKLMDEAKGKGTLAELGAKKAADEVKKEGNKRANQLVEEAGKQAQNIMTKARAEAKKVKDDAQKRVDALK
jgi:cell division septum initiation protein DivIVA